MIKKNLSVIASLSASFLLCCNTKVDNQTRPVQLITLDPGHFHAALVQKSMYPDVDSIVHVYSPPGADLNFHLARVTAYNGRQQDPTHWKEEVYYGNDFFDKMLAEKKGNVVVIAGNNQKKTNYILRSLQNGFNVLADKPMAINIKGFKDLTEAFEVAEKNKLLLYDIMTERFEITSILQRELSMTPGIFGTLKQGSIDDPAIVKESIHYLYKYVSGNVLTRPSWFFDSAQQGDGITDVMTHLVDLVQWESFPDSIIDYRKDVKVNTARHWTTDLRQSEFTEITKLDSFPGFLRGNITDSILHVYTNGEINYQVRGVHAKTLVEWKYKAPEGTGDTYYAMMQGSRCNLVVRQGAAEKYKPVLYIEGVTAAPGFEAALVEKITSIQAKYPGVDLRKIAPATAAGSTSWEVIIPEKYREGHEEHFARVTKNFLAYLKTSDMPAWEVPGMLAKYYTTTKALEIALQNK